MTLRYAADSGTAADQSQQAGTATGSRSSIGGTNSSGQATGVRGGSAGAPRSGGAAHPRAGAARGGQGAAPRGSSGATTLSATPSDAVMTRHPMHLLGTTEAPVPPDVPGLPGGGLPSVPGVPHLIPPTGGAITVPGIGPKLPKLPVLRLGQDPAVVFSKWGSNCNVAKPGKPGTADFISYYQHNSANSAGSFPVSAFNYPCGAGWVVVPGSTPVVPPVWIGKSQPWQPPTNIPGGQIFIAADVPANQLMGELASVGLPLSSSGQLVTYGGDGTPIYTPDWWGLSPVIKNGVAQVLLSHDSHPDSEWRSDPYHWGYGNIGVGLPTIKI